MLAKWLGKFATGLALVAFVTGLPKAVEAGPKGKSKATKPALLFNIDTRRRSRNKPTDWFQYSGSASLKAHAEHNLRRDDDQRDFKRDFGASVEGWARAQVTDRVVAFGHVQYGGRRIQTHSGSYPTRSDYRVKEALISFATGHQSQLTLGRMRFSDPAKWIADGAVDGVHFARQNHLTGWEIAAFRGTEDSRPTFAMAHHTWTTATGRRSLLALAERDGRDRRAYLFGHLAQRRSEAHRLQINAAVVLGDAANQKSTGVGIDLRGIRTFEGKLNPQITYGVAVGSLGFRQTGLETNKTYDGGQKQFNRYGYLYRPELTNLAVATLAAGIRPSRSLSMDLGLHLYAQAQPSTTAPIARIDGSTTGKSRFAGTEVSLVGAWRPNKKTKLQFGLGLFQPGSAYADRSSFSRLFAQLSVYFLKN